MFKLIEKDWFKRRLSKRPQVPCKVEVFDFKKEKNHFCTLTVHFEDGTSKNLYSRVIQNHITKDWVVDGMEFAVRLVQ